MKSYRTETPRPALAFLAVAATVATLALALAPAQSPEEATVAAVVARPTEVAIVPARIDVVAARPQTTTKRDVARQQG